jgi:hypothetical protein
MNFVREKVEAFWRISNARERAEKPDCRFADVRILGYGRKFPDLAPRTFCGAGRLAARDWFCRGERRKGRI